MVIISISLAFIIREFFMVKIEQHTNNAYIRADMSSISPRVSGQIADILVNDNQWVKQGDLLAVIDPREFEIFRDQTIAKEHASLARKQNTEASLIRQDALLSAAAAELKSKKSELSFARQQQVRYQKMAQAGSGSLESADKAITQASTAAAQVIYAEATLKASKDLKLVLRSELADAQSGIELAQAQRAMAELNLTYTKIIAPISGTIDGKRMRVGEQVKPGDTLLSIVPQDNLYIIANYQETQLEKILPGQWVDIHADTLPGKKLRGRVDSIAPASGVSFSLIKPENATGNFTKVVQRIPVKIVFIPEDEEQKKLYRALRVGMSVEVKINTEETDIK